MLHRLHTHHSPCHRVFLLSLLALMVVGSSACGAPPPKVYRVGILSGLPPFAAMADGFQARMAELGYVEGRNITYDRQAVNPGSAEEQRAAHKFVDEHVDLIFVFPTEASLTVKAVTQGTNIPVVFASATLEGVDLVRSVREPGGNLTGLRFPGPELMVARTELLHEIVPHAKRIGIFYNPHYPANQSGLEALRAEAPALGITFVEITVPSVPDLQTVLQTRAHQPDIGMDAIVISTDDVTQSPDGWPLISAFAAAHRIPIAGSAAFEADSGALFTYIPDNIETGRMAAPLADKIFSGIAPGTIPVVTPDPQLRINYQRAQTLGLTIPDRLLKQAADIIR